MRQSFEENIDWSDDELLDGAETDLIQEDDLRNKTLELLEFPLIRERLADRTTYFPARQLALRLTPSYLEYEVEALQQETVEGRSILDEGGDVNLHTNSDIATSVARASLGGVLTGVELLGIAESLDVFRTAKNGVIKERNTAPTLAEIAEGIPDLQELRRQIRSRIGNRGEVVDDATHTLKALRGQIRQAYEHVTSSLTGIIQSPLGQDALQDDVISIRNERLVVQVKSEMRSRVPGIVHDASNTGATLFVEPFTTVDLGNTWRELGLEEQREVLRVLRDLSTLVGQLANDIHRGNELTAHLDFILARARYSYSIRGISALPVQPDPRPGEAIVDSPPTSNIRLVNARHPLLGSNAVPISINIGPDWSVLVITGPNTGGKTVAMKTVGLLALMHQSGLQVPADYGSVLPVLDGVYADVGDQQSIEESVSTFSSHMRNVVEILGAVTKNSLVLLDELGTSTDPEEGSALAKAILDHLATHGVSTIVTTHHRNVATFAEASPGMMNGSVQLDATTLAPTYHLTMGIPGRSYAMAVASSLGLPKEIMDNAESLMEPQHRRFEDWLNELQRDREQLQTRLQEAEEASVQTTSLRQQVQEQIDYLITYREDILDSTRRQILSQYEDVRRKLRRAEAALSWSAPSGQPTTRAELSRIRREIEAQRDAVTPTLAPVPPRIEHRELAIGDVVFVRGLNLRGSVVSLPNRGGEAEISIGKVKIQVDPNRLSLVDAPPLLPQQQVHIDIGPMLTSTELDLRGQRAEEALINLEEFLDKAVRDGLSSVRIIHGRGTGALRHAVREHMRRHPLARSFEAEAREYGGDGATKVQLS